MKLRDLVQNESAPQLELAGLAEHSAEVRPGDGFVAIGLDTERKVANCYDAIARGAGALLVDAPLDDLTDVAIPVVSVPGLTEERGALAARFYDYPSRELSCLGVTGTNGKTSIAHYFADLSGQLDVMTGYGGTLGWGVPGNSKLVDVGMTTPNAVALQRLLREFVDAGCQRVALEVSSHALAQERSRDVSFSHAIFSNLSRDHLDYHGTLENYQAAKRKLFTEWPLESAVINVDDEFGRTLCKQAQGEVITYGQAPKGDKRVKNRRADWSYAITPADTGSLWVDWHSPYGDLSSRLPVVADFAVANVTACMALLAHLGHDLEAIGSALAMLRPVAGRMERVGTEPTVIVDYAHTPDALDQVLRTLRSSLSEKSRLICVVGCGGDRDRGKRPMMANVSAEYAHEQWFTSDNPRTENPQSIIDDMLGEGFTGSKDRVHIEVDRARAIERAIAQADSIDVVLIAGKGHEDYQEIGGTKHVFDDRLVARAAIESKVSGGDSAIEGGA